MTKVFRNPEEIRNHLKGTGKIDLVLEMEINAD